MARSLLGLTLVALLAGCGARTSPSVDGDAGAPRRDAGDIDAAGFDAGPPWACRYEQTGEPIVIYDMPLHRDGIEAPELIVLEEGSETRLALAATHPRGWHPEIHVAELFVGASWPDDVRTGRSWVHVGIDAHSHGQLAHTANDSQIALAWYQGDFARGAPQGVSIRRLNTDTWQAGSAVLVEEDSNSAWALVPWQGGHALAFRPTTVTEAAVALLDESGRMIGEPIVTNPRLTGPAGTSVASTGSSLVTVTNDEAGTSFGRIAAPTYEETDRVAALMGRRPRAPTVRAEGDLTYAIWREESLDEEDRSFAMRVARLSAEGAVQALPLGDVVNAVQGPDIVVSPTGAMAVWAERREPEGIDLVLQRVTPEDEVAERLVVPTTNGVSRGPGYHGVTLRNGRVLLLTWSGYVGEDNDRDVFLARFDCRDI